MRRREEREDEQIGVPEDVTAIGVTGEPARADCRLAAVCDRRHQMEERQPHLELELCVAAVDA